MRLQAKLAIFALLTAIALPVCAASPDDVTPDQQRIAALEAKISQAQPREQCFLYAQLIHQMTEVSVRQYEAGNVSVASKLLLKIQQLASKFHLTVNNKDKRLKKAEILLDRTAFRLNEMLHPSDYEDRPLVKETLAQVSQAQNDAMMRVFQK